MRQNLFAMQSRLGPGCLLVGLIVALAGCTSAPSAGSVPLVSPATAPATVPASAATQAPDMSRTSDGGQVTVVATWAGPTAGAAFEVSIDTHSVDLDGFDLADAMLRSDRGETLTARPWTAPAGGHHRSGILRFEGDALSLLAGASWIELVLSGIGDIPERTLRWTLTP